jgi:hypothetical protein
MKNVTGISDFIQKYILDPKKGYPRLQVVNLDTLDAGNIDAFLGVFAEILQGYQDIYSREAVATVKDRHFQNFVSETNKADPSRPSFHFALDRDQAFPNGKNLDVKKLIK